MAVMVEMERSRVRRVVRGQLMRGAASYWSLMCTAPT